MTDFALTIPAAAQRVPFSESTLRTYVQAWERTYCDVPKDTAGYIRLTPAFLDVFTGAHELRNEVWKIDARLKQAVSEHFSALPQMISQYRTSGRLVPLTGVEELAKSVTNETLVQLIARLDYIEKTGMEAYNLIHDAIDDAVGVLRYEMHTWSKVQADDTASIAAAIDHHVRRLRTLSNYFLKHSKIPESNAA